MHRAKKQKVQYEHGDLVPSLLLKPLIVNHDRSFLVDDFDNTFEGVGLEGLEENKTVEVRNVVIEKRNSFSYSYGVVSTKETTIAKSKKQIKKSFKMEFEKFDQAKAGKVTNVKCLIVKKSDAELKLYDGSFFRMKLFKPLNLDHETDKIEISFVKKSSPYNFIWKTRLTQIIAANEKEEFWQKISIPETKLFKKANDIPIHHTGKWVGMLTTVKWPYTYGKVPFFCTLHYRCCTKFT